ncbi:hypothetical protein BIV57_01230 [Mangrovactinospora gilvigrisea]|uniref:Uncharacterized protein n=1 Tax=Mangrovactinospora gilvigrisea TaxID=1428644 RepID=A0A1J7CD45_9ACTN|nr:hypothetical protein [Mangrovactinospora gilvigrisea]OIV39484.1 hypothetical protein BIV57_01230 [Mangrovactinospora gilvigrisea]
MRIPRILGTTGPRRRARRAAVVAATALTLAAAGIAGPGTAGASARPKAPFAVFTSERKADSPGLDQYGATDAAATVYDAFHFSCTDTGCASNHGANPMPTKDQYQAMVRAYVAQFHAAPNAPVLLDFEGIILSSLKGQAATHALALWKQLILWTHQAMPKAPVGIYSWDWLTANLDLTQQLHAPGLLDFFAPDAYIYATTDPTMWAQHVAQSAANDRSIAPKQPIYSFVSPQTGPPNGPSMSADQVRRMFTVIKSNDQGMIMWEPAPAADASACGWLGAFSAEVAADQHRRIQSGPLAATATAPDGSCAVTAGATTALTVTLTNTSHATTSATVLQMPYALPAGLSGTWSNASVPALEPGATFRTTLQLTVAATHTVSSAPLHLTTALGDSTVPLALG